MTSGTTAHPWECPAPCPTCSLRAVQGSELAETVMKVLEAQGSASSAPLRHRAAHQGEDPDNRHRDLRRQGCSVHRHGGAGHPGHRAAGYGKLPICMAKTQLSITDNPKLKGAPRGWTLTVKEVLVSAGAGFIVPLCGEIMLIPGLPSEPAAQRIDLTADGRFIGLS